MGCCLSGKFLFLMACIANNANCELGELQNKLSVVVADVPKWMIKLMPARALEQQCLGVELKKLF